MELAVIKELMGHLKLSLPEEEKANKYVRASITPHARIG